MFGSLLRMSLLTNATRSIGFVRMMKSVASCWNRFGKTSFCIAGVWISFGGQPNFWRTPLRPQNDVVKCCYRMGISVRVEYVEYDTVCLCCFSAESNIANSTLRQQLGNKGFAVELARRKRKKFNLGKSGLSRHCCEGGLEKQMFVYKARLRFR